MKKYIALLALAIFCVSPSATFGAWSFSIAPSLVIYNSNGSVTTSVFATHTFTDDQTIFSATVDFSGATSETGANGIEGTVTSFGATGTVSANTAIEIGTLTFTDNVGGTGQNPVIDSFDVNASIVSIGNGVNLFEDVLSIEITAIPEPATLATFGLVIGSCFVSRRRRV